MKRDSIKVNFFYNLVCNVINIIIPLLTAPYTSRVLGAANIGINSFTYSIVSTLVMVGAMGTATYGQKEIAAVGDNIEKRSEKFWGIWIFRAISISIVFIIFLFVAFTSNNTKYFLLQAPYFAAAIVDISFLFSGMEKFKYTAVRNSVIRVVCLILIFLLVKNENHLWIYILIVCLSQFFGYLSMWAYLKGNVCKVSLHFHDIISHFSPMIVYFIPTITYQIYAVLDKAMLGWLVGSDYENGYYEQAHKIVNMAIGIISAFTIVMRSKMTYLYSRNDYREIDKKLSQGCSTMAFMVFPISFGLALINKGMVPWFFGAGYDKVITLLYVFCPFFAFMGYSRLIGTHMLTPSGRQGRSNVAQCSAAVVNLIFNMILIPKYYAIGAAIASVISELTILVIYYYFVRKELSLMVIIKTGWKKLLAALIMFVAVYPLTNRLPISILSTFIVVVCGATIYIGVLFVIRDELLLTNYRQLKSSIAKKIKK